MSESDSAPHADNAPTPTENVQELRLALGAEPGFVVMNVGQYTLRFTPEQAETLATDLRGYSIEVRNNGRLM